MTREFHWKYTPGCPCEDCKEYVREQEPAFKFQKMEDERALFEVWARDQCLIMTRCKHKGSHPSDDYVNPDTWIAWSAWLTGTGVEWVPTP